MDSPVSHGLAFKSTQIQLFRIVKLICYVAIAVAPGAAHALNAQQTSTAAQSTTPERAFIANGGGDFGVGLSITGVVEGGVAERAYNEFFAGMKNWGRYEIVANPARADWVFEISVSNDPTCVGYRVRNATPQNDYRIELAMTNVKTRDEKRFIEHVKQAGFFSDPDKIFDRAVAALVDNIKEQVGQPSAKPSLASNVGTSAPVPPRIGAAQNVFIHDVSAKDILTEKYSGGGTQVYDQFSAAVKSWGRYTLVPTADEADLVFEISFSMQLTCYGADDPQLRLVVLDARTRVLLWGFTNHVSGALLTGNARKNFAREMSNLVSQVREIAERPTWLANASTTSIPSVPAAVNSQTVAGLASNGPSIPVTISATKSVVKAGAEVRVSVTLKNASKRDLDFAYPSGDPLTCMVIVHDANGNAVADTEYGRNLKTARAGWQGQAVKYTLNPGETQTRECAVSELYDMTAPGKYSIEIQQLDGRAVQSNAVTVTVAP